MATTFTGLSLTATGVVHGLRAGSRNLPLLTAYGLREATGAIAFGSTLGALQAAAIALAAWARATDARKPSRT
jgi:hypothetical protein